MKFFKWFIDLKVDFKFVFLGNRNNFFVFYVVLVKILYGLFKVCLWIVYIDFDSFFSVLFFELLVDRNFDYVCYWIVE